MNPFYRQLTRKALPTVLLALLLASACAFCSIGGSAWYTAERQLSAADGQYTTIAIPNQENYSTQENFRGQLFIEDGQWKPLSQHGDRTYPGLLREDFRGYLAAQVRGLSSLSAYEQWDFRSTMFDAYGNMMGVFAVRCIDIDPHPFRYDIEGNEPETTNPDSYYYYNGHFSVEDVVCRKPEHDITPEKLTFFFQSWIRTEEGEVPFEVGHTYLLFGYHEGLVPYYSVVPNPYHEEGEPRWVAMEEGVEFFRSDLAPGGRGGGTVTYIDFESGAFGDATGGNALFYWREVQGDDSPYPHKVLAESSLPFYAEYEGDWREFLESEEGRVWREEIIPLCQLNYETVGVILTDNIHSMLSFNDGRASILEGREISAEEYASGSPVCLVSAAYARKNGLAVGDTIDLDFYRAGCNYQLSGSAGQSLLMDLEPVWVIDSCVPVNRLDLEKEYTIVGLYTAPEFGYGWHSFNGNTVFVPKASIPHAEEYEDFWVPMLYSILLENGKAEEFEAYLESIGFGGLFEYYDQDYNAASAAFAAMAENARRLFLVGLGALALAGALFLFLSLRRLAPTARGMRLMGIPAKKVWRELWAALAVLVLASAALGALLGWWLYGAVTGRTLAAGMGLRPEALALCAAVQAAALAVLAALAAIPAARPRLLRAGGKKR